MKKLQGTWMMILGENTYYFPMFVEFQDKYLVHFGLLEEAGDGLLRKKQEFKEMLSDKKMEFVNNNRVRIYRMGKSLTVISETESISEDTEFATNYERILPTKTSLTREEIAKLKFKALWNGETISLAFNKSLDGPYAQIVNKRLKSEGQKMVLERYQDTYFASFLYNGQRKALIGIKEIDKEKAILFGFPERPYEVTAS